MPNSNRITGQIQRGSSKGGTKVLIERRVIVTNTTEADFTWVDGLYSDIYVQIDNMQTHSADDGESYLRVSTDGGSTFLTSGYVHETFPDTTWLTLSASITQEGTTISSNDGLSCKVHLAAVNDTTYYHRIYTEGSFLSSSSVLTYYREMAHNTTTSSIDAIRIDISSSSDQIGSGVITVHGVLA